MRLENKLNIDTICDIIGETDIVTDIITSLCGDFLGEGTYRSTFAYALDPKKYVVKIEKESTSCNLVEYMMWQEIEGLCGDLEWVKKWFAPVKWVSPNGKVLIMERTFEKDLKRPEKVPKFLWDVKANNFGWIGKNFVCHDYGQFYNFLHYPKGMKKAIWY